METTSTMTNRTKFAIMCRLCMDTDVLLVNIHPTDGLVKQSPGNIVDVIEKFTTVKIDPSEDLPQKICENCVQTINAILAFRNKCKRNDEKLHKIVQTQSVDESNILIEIIDDSDTNENSDGNAGDSEFSVQPHKYVEAIFQRENDSQKELRSINQATEFEGRRRPEKVACHICGKTFKVHVLKFHINKHNGLQPYKCDEAECTSKFSAPYYLSRHKRLCHSLKPLLHCDVCGRGFKLKFGLEIHRSYHFDPSLPCKICEKLFRNKRALNKHMLVHSQERKFKCEICNRSYQTRYTLRIHKRVHTQEKPYSCHCGVSFAYKCLLKAHSEKYHKEETKLS